MFNISSQVHCKWLRKTRHIEFLETLLQPALLQPGKSLTMFWTDADLLTLEQIYKKLGISETKLDLCMPKTPVQF